MATIRRRGGLPDRGCTRLRLTLLSLLMLVGVQPAIGQAPSPVGKVISEVIPQNNRTQPDRRILAQMQQTRTGRPFSHIGAQEDVARLIRTGLFRNVNIATKMTENDQVQVFVVVDEYPSVVTQIVYRGAEHIGKDKLDEITGLKTGEPMNPVRNQIARQAILREYHDQGRSFAQVHLREGTQAEDTRIVFDITEGPVVRVSSIEFVGNTVATDTKLSWSIIESSKATLGLFGGQYHPGQVELDVAALKEYYRSLGFHAVRIRPEVVKTEDLSRVKLIYHIDEGPRHVIRGVQLNGNKAFTKEMLMAQTEARPGQFYDRRVIHADLENIKNYYGYRGRLVPVREEVYLDPDRPGEVQVQYEVLERPATRVGNVIIQGNTVTRDDVIREQIPLFPGQILSYPDLLVAEANLARLGIFTNQQTGEQPTVSILEPEDPASTFRDVLIQVQEQPTGSILLGGGINSDAGLSGSIVLNERNFDITRLPTSFEDLISGKAFRGGGQELRIEAVPGTIFQRYTVSFRDPTLFNTPNSLGVSGYYFMRAYPEFNESRLGGRFTLGRQLNRFWSVNLTTRVESVDVFDVPFNAPLSIAQDRGKSFVTGFSAGVRRDTRDSFIRPTTGSEFDANFEQVVGDFTYPLGSINTTLYQTVYEQIDGTGKHVVSFRNSTLFAGNNTPVFDRLYAGGFRSLRGFEFRGVGPYENGFNVGGTFAFVNSLQYELPVLPNDRALLVGFVDSGTVESDVKFSDYRVSAGFGVRIAVPGMGPIPLAFDFAWPINTGPHDREQIFSFYLSAFR